MSAFDPKRTSAHLNCGLRPEGYQRNMAIGAAYENENIGRRRSVGDFTTGDPYSRGNQHNDGTNSRPC